MINYQILTGFANQLNQSSDCYDSIVAVAAQPKYSSTVCSDAFDQARWTLTYLLLPSFHHLEEWHWPENMGTSYIRYDDACFSQLVDTSDETLLNGCRL